MTREPGPRHALVHFPLAGDREHGLAAVRVIDWGQPGYYTRMTLAGPTAHELRKDEEIEATIRTERLCGGCRPAVPDGQLMVELVAADGAQVCGASYTLALVLADKLARGCLPRLAGRSLIASGQVKRDGAVVPVGRMAEKLAALARALEQRPIAAPLLVLARENLAALTTEEQSVLRGLIASGVQCVGVAALVDMGSDWPPEPRSEPGPDPFASPWRGWFRKRRGAIVGALDWRKPVPRPGWRKPRLAAALVTLLIGGLLILYSMLSGPCSSLSSDPAIIERCWGSLPVTFSGDCSVEHQNGDRPPRHCPSGTCLAADDTFSLEVRPAAAGWLYVYYADAQSPVFADLRPDPRPWLVHKDQRLPLTLPARINPPVGRPAQGRFFAVLTRAPLPAADGAAQPVLNEFLDVAAEEFVLCGDPQ